MERSYWEKMAPDYNDEIFDVRKSDTKGIITKAINNAASPSKTVIDIGCAIGKWLPILSPVFKKVHAIDISLKNLQIAEKLYPEYKNVTYSRIDMSNPKAVIPRCDVAICINAILTGTQHKRDIFFSKIRGSVKKNGTLILVVPSLESSMLTSIIRQRWNPDKDAKSQINKKGIKKQLQLLLQGITNIDNVPHKHYLKEELQVLLNNEGFSAEQFNKIEYGWDTEFLKPLKWLKDPRPWDWMVLAKKK